MKAIVRYKDLMEEKFFYEEYDFEDNQLILKDDEGIMIHLINLDVVRSVKFIESKGGNKE